MKKISSKFKSKPSYDLYLKLWNILDLYFLRVNIYIFFNYYDLNNIDLIKVLTVNDNNKFKSILSYDYKVFKMYLFLYWDLEYYLEGKNNVKDLLIVDIEKLNFSGIKFSKEIKSNATFLELISIRESINLWTNLEILGMFKILLKYNVYSKIDILNTKYKNHSKIKIYKKYRKYNSLISEFKLIEIYKLNKKIESSFYESYIEKWYEEWKSEITLDLLLKYKDKIKILDNELKKLIKILNKHDETKTNE